MIQELAQNQDMDNTKANSQCKLDRKCLEHVTTC
jgi:hypothetical protein